MSTRQWKNIAGMIGTITGVISLLGIVYAIGFKMGSIETKVSTLWDFFIEDVAERSISESHQSSGNPVVNSPNPQVEIPQNFLSVVQRITRDNINKDVYSTVSLIMQQLAVHQRDQMNSFIKDNNLTIAEFISLIAEKIVALKEDCIRFDYRRAEVERIGDRWKIVVGPMWLKDFGNSEREARQALRIIRHYRMNQQCFVGRPDPPMEYYLVNGRAPVGSLGGEDCVSFNPANIEVKRIGGRWKIVEGTHWIMDFSNKEGEARMAFKIIKKYGFNRICFVGRPDPSMIYFRR